MKVWSSEGPSLVEWCPIRDDARLFAMSPLNSQTPSLSLNRFDFVNITPTIENVATFQESAPFTTLSWCAHQNFELGLLATGHSNGSINLFSPSDQQKLSTLSFHKKEITCLAFNPTLTNVLLSVSSDNEISVWDITNPENGKHRTTGSVNRSVQGTITNVDWHKKSSLSSLFALCDATGLCVVWDLRMSRSTHNFADSSFKSELSDIKFAPHSPTLLATASSDTRNSVVLLWDLRNTTLPQKKLHGHTSGVARLVWPSCDERILLSAGKDGNIIAWNTETGEQLSTVFENSSPITQLSWSPYFHGAVLSSNQTNTNLYSFTDPAAGVSSKLSTPSYQFPHSGIDVAFDGRIYQSRRAGHDESYQKSPGPQQYPQSGQNIRHRIGLSQPGRPRRLLPRIAILCIMIHVVIYLQGRVKFPIGGIVRERYGVGAMCS